MTLLLIEGFEGFAAANAAYASGALSRKYPSASSNETSIYDVAGRWSGSRAVKLTNSSNAIGLDGMTTDRTLIVGVALAMAAGVATEQDVITVYSGGSRGINLRRNSNNGFSIYRDTTLLESRGFPSLVTGGWVYLELKVYCDDTAGTWEMRINGKSTPVLSGTGNTKVGSNNYYDGFRLNNAFGCQPCYDDLYVLDGTSGLSDFLGVQQVVTLLPTGAGDSTDWTPSGGANYTCVDDPTADNDSTYVAKDAAAATDLYAFADTPSGQLANGVAGVQINADARLTAAGSASLKLPAKTSGTQSDGSAITIISTSYKTISRVMAKDPSDASWTVTNLDASQFGVTLN